MKKEGKQLVRNNSRRRLGAWGETVASNFLERLGYRIVIRNFYTRWGEIDIVARFAEIWIFVEVKLRSTHSGSTEAWQGSAERAITYTKQQHWLRAAKSFCYTHGISPDTTPIRFEEISIYLDRTKQRARIIKYILPIVVYYFSYVFRVVI